HPRRRADARRRGRPCGGRTAPHVQGPGPGRALTHHNPRGGTPMAHTITFDISGMTCDHCVHAVATALQDVPGVRRADVSLDEKRAVVEGDAVDVEKAIAAVAEEGYTATLRG